MVNLELPWKSALTVREIWFPTIGETIALSNSWRPRWLRLFHLERRIGKLLGRWERRQTLITDLGTLDSLLERMSQTMRYDIRRALSRDGLRFVDDWTPEQLVAFAASGDAGNTNQPALARLSALRAQGRLTIRASLADHTPLCAHAFIDDGRIARALHSYSIRRSVDKMDAPRVARATKALYFLDLHYMRDRGLREFDWGGISGRPGNGIDALKMEYRGTPRHTWCFDGLWLPYVTPLRF